MKAPRIQNPIRGFAVLCVAVIAAYIMWVGYQLIGVLAGPTWCRTALGAEKISGEGQQIEGLTACVALLTIQLKSLATNSHILFGVLAGCLLVLIVIVIAGGRLNFAVNKDGVTGDIGRDDAAAGAKQVAERADKEADDIAAGKPVEPRFTAPPGEEL